MKQIKELQRLLGKKTMENELLKEAVEYGRAKKWIAHAPLLPGGWGVSLVSRCLRVSRAQLYVILRRTDDWMDGRPSRHTDDTDVLLRIHHVIGELPTYGYRRVWALLRRQAELDGMPAINAKRVYRIMRQNALLLERKPTVPPSKRAHTGRVAVKESNQRWCSDGFEFCCDNGERLRVTFALDCCDREALHWAVTTGGFNSETVQDVMLGAVERRFGNDLPSSPVEWLTDNGSCYRANETRQFARMLGLEPKNTAVRSPESNGIAESFVKTIKRDYISIMPKPDGLTAAKNLAEAFEHYNEWHPHSALGYRSPREYLRQQASNGLSDNRCLEI
ncbi:IS3 family transposase, partial [Escherichia coli]|uniref:IS3 family transposase n=1 Tax=Escherichia coli TaxID=562 RepID=UPI00098AE823